MARLVERLARSGHGSALAAQPAGSGLAAAPGPGGRLDAGFAVLLVGASLEQSIKQLPARHRICPAAFAAYSQAADLRNGIPWYATLGLGAPALTLAAATVGRRHRPPAQRRALAMAAGLTVGHLLVTAVAAPVTSPSAPTPATRRPARVFDTFERLTAARTVLQAATLAAMGWALAAATNPPSRPPEPPSPPPGLRTPTAGPTASSR
jgi:hypothetical protein